MSTGRSREASSQPYLPRGAACVSCRRRKMKCDGCHPICGQCQRSGRAEDCEYVGGQERSQVQLLEEGISTLEARIRELQVPRRSIHTGPSRTPTNGMTRVKTPRPASASTFNTPGPLQDPPKAIGEQLVDSFLTYGVEFGFFLHPARFRSRMFQPYPIGHDSRPAPALIFAVYLWAIFLCPDVSIKVNETAYFDRAVQEAATALLSKHPHKTMHSLQAEVLLANYFFARGRFVEGKHHLAFAVSTALSAGLHRIRSANWMINPNLPTPRDSVEEGELILGWWTVFNLDKAWAAGLICSPNFEHSDHPMATQIDTPWPLEMEDYEQGHLPPNARTANTVNAFLQGVETHDLGLSARAIETKAIILWDRVRAFIAAEEDSLIVNAGSTGPRPEEQVALDKLIDDFKASIPPPHHIVRVTNVEHIRRLSAAYCILCAATIRLHASRAWQSDASHNKRLEAAQVILDVTNRLKQRRLERINPIIGSIWADATQVLYDQITFIRSSRAANPQWSGSGSLDEAQISKLVHIAVQSMRIFAADIPLLTFQVSRITQTYEPLS